MGILFTRMQNTDVFTANGAKTNATSGSKLLDFYFIAGASRGMAEDEIRAKFDLSLKEDFTKTIRVLFYTRDCRTGRGERKVFNVCVKYLYERFININNDNKLKENLDLFLSIIPEFGYWKDLLNIFNAKTVAPIFIKALNEPSTMGLAAKWLPRQTYKEHGEIVTEIRNLMGLTPKQYRKMLVEKTNVVESLMCERKFNEIDFSKVPSKAFNIYKNAFQKQAPENFESFMTSLFKGESKVNAGQLFPYDLFMSFYKGDRQDLIQAQWNALNSFEIPEDKRIITVVDTSSSMNRFGRVDIKETTLQPRAIAYSLGVYFSEKIKGIFKDKIITYSKSARFIELAGTVCDKFKTIIKNSIVENTNIESVFNLILNAATNNSKGPRVKGDEIPNMILVLSDKMSCRLT